MIDINLIRGAVEIIVFGAFLGIAWWAYLPSRKGKQDRIAQSIVGEDS